MAIVKMKKFTLFAFKQDREAILTSLQKFEGVQFNNLQIKLKEDENLKLLQADSDEVKASDVESKQAKVKAAIDFLDQHIPRESGIKAMMNGKRDLTYDAVQREAQQEAFLEISEQIKQYESRLAFIKAETARLTAEINSLSPWQRLDIPFGTLKTLHHATSYLGVIPLNVKEKFKSEVMGAIDSLYLEAIGESKEGASFFMLAHKSESVKLEDLLKKYSFTSVSWQFETTPSAQIEALEAKIQEYVKESHGIHMDVENFADKVASLELGYEYLGTEVLKAKECSNFIKTNQVLIIEGWVTSADSESLESVIGEAAKETFVLELEEPKEEDEVPIQLKNSKMGKPFETFVHMYGMPKYNGIDPTMAIVPFYMLFYGMMLSDAVYGFVQLVGCWILLKKFKLSDSMKNMVTLFYYLSFPTIIIGVLFGSYLTGMVTVPPIWMDPTKNVILLLGVSFGIGIIHIFTGLFIKAYMLIRQGQFLDAFYDVGLWVITLVSAILFGVGAFGGISAFQSPIFMYVMFAGMLGLLLTQGRSAKSIGGKLGAGLYGLYGITGYVGDIVSYSRLMALGLATSFIGSAFNSIITLFPGITVWIFGPIIFLIGHVFNMFINALGGYVHSLRLQYLEYFGKFYESGGKPFTPFKAKSKYINIIKN